MRFCRWQSSEENQGVRGVCVWAYRRRTDNALDQAQFLGALTDPKFPATNHDAKEAPANAERGHITNLP